MIISNKKLKASDKTVQKMSRDGLVEQNLSTGEKQRVTKREQDFSFGKKADTDPRKLSAQPQRSGQSR